MKIHLLSEQAINRIATGEIIDRPLSVVKELVENAIDAGASKCLINLERGGRTLISVSDNGCGILKEDLKLAVTRYATSKLPDEDISNIQYMGFRGEALSSIATSARLSITSKTSKDANAWIIDLSNGIDQYHIQPTSHKEGTTVDVENLFCFIPNRIRFLRPESTEIIACKNLIGALAICHQQIHFKKRY
jgi:DNA mismatch repair protein MutL